MLNLVFLGPPGAGKGTQSANIVEDFGVVQISTGDILRKAVKDGTDMGKLAKKFMDEGKLVTDDIIVGIMKDRLAEDDCKNGFILDGFPRTTAQAVALDAMLKDQLKTQLTHIVSLEVPDELLYERLTGRRSCPTCGRAYHVSYNPPKKDGVCDADGEALIQRDDDKQETISKRLNVYHETTSLLKDYYKGSGKLSVLDGNREPETVYAELKGLLSR